MRQPWFNIVCEMDAESKPAPNIRDIQRVVCGRFPGVSLNDINSSRRTVDVIKPRRIAMYLARHLTTKSYATIGKAFGCKDHTTIHAAVQRMERILIDDSSMKQILASISAELGCAT